MSDKPKTRNNQEQQAARLTAFVLDQLNGDERAAAEAELVSVPGQLQVYEELTQIAEELQAGQWGDSASERSSVLRTAILQQFPQLDETVELPKRESSSRRRWALVITVSAAVLLLLIALQPAMVPDQLANNIDERLLTHVEQPSEAADVANFTTEASGGQQIELTKAESEALALLIDGPVEELKQSEKTAALVKRVQEQLQAQTLARGGQSLPQGTTKSRIVAGQDVRAVFADLELNESEMKQLAIKISQAQQLSEAQKDRQVEIRRIDYGTQLTDRLSSVKTGAVVGTPFAGVNGLNASGGKPATTRLAVQPPFYPDRQGAQVRGSWEKSNVTWADGAWHVQMDDNGNGTPDAYGAQAPQYRYYTTRTEEELGEAKRGSKRWDVEQARTLQLLQISGNEQYAPIVENQFAAVTDKPVSTFSIDVDTASYANVRRFLTQDQLPPPNAVRLEELINYFRYEYPEPKEGADPFSVSMEVAECPWQPVHQIVRIGLKGKHVPRKERPPSSLVFLLDVSGSMQDANKLPLLKKAMKLLTDQLTENDRVTIVTYAGEAGLALDTTNGESKETIRKSIDGLNANGSTNGSAGIQLAYEKATQAFIQGGANRVILATDGDLNVGVTDDGDLVKLIAEKAKSGVFLTVLGFGEGNLKDGKLEKLADNGNGMYAYVDSFREARKVLVEQISGSLVTIAKDVKIKVEFNPAEVGAYRLLGYENRLMTSAEFNDDAKDAGEIGAGHTVTALYELVPKKANPKFTTSDGLKYQRVATPTEPPKELTDAAKTGELLTLSLRYKRPDADESTLLESVVKNEQRAFDDASADFRFAASVASFGMHLRNSKHRGSTSFAAIEETAASAIGDDPQGHRTEFVDLVRRASQLVSKRGQ